MARCRSLPLLAAIAAHGGRASLDEVARATGLEPNDAATSLGVLYRRGLIDRPERGVYVLLDSGQVALDTAAPVKSGPTGPASGIRRCHDTLRERLWDALRMARKGSLPGLLRRACRGGERSPEKNAAKYLRALERVGIVRQLDWREPGTALTSPGRSRWLLVKDLGPRAPIWSPRRVAVYDPNTGECYPVGDSHE